MKTFKQHISEKEEQRVKERQKREKLDQDIRHNDELIRAKQRDFELDRQEIEKKNRENVTKEDFSTPPEVGTDEIVSRYKKFIPNQ